MPPVPDAAAVPGPSKTTPRFWRSPPGRPTHLLLAVACGLLVWGMRVPGGDVPFLVAGAIAGLLTVAIWLVRALVLAASVLARAHRPRSARTPWARWSIVPLVSAGLILALWFDAPFAVAFKLSRPALQRAADELAGGGDRQQRTWLGLFPIARIQSIPGGVEFTIGLEAFMWGTRGFYFSRTRAPVENAHYHRQRRIDDHWFVWDYGGW